MSRSRQLTHHIFGVGVHGSAGEGDVLPRDDDHVLGVEDGGADDALAHVPLDALANLHAELVQPRGKVALQPGGTRSKSEELRKGCWGGVVRSSGSREGTLGPRGRSGSKREVAGLLKEVKVDQGEQ